MAGGRKEKLALVFNGMQGVSAVIAILLALYAAFFTSLPELLERQLRSEVVAANEELTEVRHSKNRLEEQQETLNKANEALARQKDAVLAEVAGLKEEISKATTEGIALREANKQLAEKQRTLAAATQKLNALKADLEKQVDQLKVYRSAYARDTLKIAWARIALMTAYELETMSAIAEITSQYQAHLSWLKQAKAGKLVDAPKGWFRVPMEPYTDLRADDRAMGEIQVRILNVIGSPSQARDFERFSREWLETRILSSRGASEMTAASFIAHIKSYPFLTDVLPEERSLIADRLDAFLRERVSEPNEPINVVFSSMPPVKDLEAKGTSARARLSTLQAALDEFLNAQKEALTSD